MTRSGGDDGAEGDGTAHLATLREREALMAEAEGIAHVGSYLWEPGRDPVWSDGMCRVLGYVPGQVVPGADAFYSRVHPDDLERVRRAQIDLPEGARSLTVLDKPIAPDRLVAEVQKHME